MAVLDLDVRDAGERAQVARGVAERAAADRLDGHDPELRHLRAVAPHSVEGWHGRRLRLVRYPPGGR